MKLALLLILLALCPGTGLAESSEKNPNSRSRFLSEDAVPAAVEPAPTVQQETTDQPHAPASEVPEPAVPSQITPAAEQATPATTRKISQRENLMLLEAVMVETSYNNNHNDDNRDALVTVYEKLIQLYCLPDFFVTLSHAAPPQDKTCLEWLDKLLTVDTSNPLAVCVREGFDTPSCLKAFSLQDVGIIGDTRYRAKAGPAAAADLEVEEKLARLAPQISKLSTDAKLALDEWAKNASDRSLEDRTRAAYGQLLQVACLPGRIKLVPMKEDQWEEYVKSKALPDAKPAQDSLARALQALERSMKDGPERAKPKKNKKIEALNERDVISQKTAKKKAAAGQAAESAKFLKRVRLVTMVCDQKSKEILDRIPFYFPAVCNRDGFYTPACLLAMRKTREDARARARQEKTPAFHGPGAAPRETGLGTF